MSRPFSLTGRNWEILTDIIRNYISTGEPVGSKSVSEQRKEKLSPASIRNVMAELESHGYLAHPHTSAGRLPTEKAIRLYVDTLSARRLRPFEADFVETNLRAASSLEERLDRSSHVLAALTHQVGIVVSAPLSEAVLERVQFLRLSERRLLVVLVARGDVVRDRIIRLAEEIPAEELERIANYVNQNFAGWKVSATRLEILRRIEEERAAYDAILRRLRLLYLEGFLRGDAMAQIYLDGTANLVESLPALDAERLRRLLQALEEKEKLIELLDECIRDDMRMSVQKGPAGESLCVRIGLEEAYPAMQGLALIGAACTLEPGLTGRIAVIGPTRMQYERVMSAVAHLAGLFQGLSETN
ncbi:MAG: heat-inducible transcription repressor HrcA [Acidobacteria bacterium]|nr:heat-inducible transcription repressor HrcA [Acidobacteriota bacterium]